MEGLCLTKPAGVGRGVDGTYSVDEAAILQVQYATRTYEVLIYLPRRIQSRRKGIFPEAPPWRAGMR